MVKKDTVQNSTKSHNITSTVVKYIYLSYIHLGSSVCHPVVLSYSCHIPVIFLSSCHSCGTLSYSLCFSNKIDQGDETEGMERGIRDGEVGDGETEERGCEETFLY